MVCTLHISHLAKRCEIPYGNIAETSFPAYRFPIPQRAPKNAEERTKMMSTRQSALTVHAVHLDVKVASRWEAVAHLGAELERTGAAHTGYADSLVARERRFSTYLGHGIAVPHALHTHDYLLTGEGIVFARFATPIPWDDEEVSIAVAVAAPASAQVEILCRLTATFLNPGHLDTLATSADPTAIARILQHT